MDNTRAACKDSQEAYRLAFSPTLRDMNTMIRRYCNECPLKPACLREAVRTDAYGVWGGTTRDFRNELKFMKQYVS